MLEQTPPKQICFITYDEAGEVDSDSGWHGSWQWSLCTRTRRSRRSRRKQERGDHRIELNGFRYMGIFSPWTHNQLRLLNRVAEPGHVWRNVSCGCGVRHDVEVTLRPLPVLYRDLIVDAPPRALDDEDVGRNEYHLV